MSLTELASAVKEGRTSSRALITESLERIERHDGPVNSVVLTRDDEALADADALDVRIAAGEDPGPLTGLPLLVKDNEDVTGLRTTYGSLLFADAPPAERDCEAVARLRAAGAIVVGRTNLPEFALEGFTANRIFGDTNNPWAMDWSPGGSSGGSAAALAMGLAPLATGTDGGGSVRIPAAFCGLAGLKPTNGQIGRDPTPSWIDLSTKGPMASSVADAALLLEIMRGPVAGDPTALPAWAPRADAWPARILAVPRLVEHGPLPEGIQRSFDAALIGLEEATGLPIEVTPWALPAQADDDWFTIVAVEELTWIGRDRVRERMDDLAGNTRELLGHALTISVDAYVAARRRRFEYTRAVDELVGTDTIVVSPTMTVEGFYADGRKVGRDEIGTESEDCNTQLLNLTGSPALSVPAGVSDNGVPFGLQIAGPRFADDLVLAVGAAWEAARPWPAVAPGYQPYGI